MGNSRYIEGRIREGRLFGILDADGKGFYVKMFKSHWEDKTGNIFDKSSFLEEPYRLQDRDIISIYFVGERIVRLPNLETK